MTVAPLGVAIEAWGGSYRPVEAACRRAEALGLDGFYYGESPNALNLDCWTTLAGLARTTDRIRLGPVITNVLPAYRSTILLAKQAATVAIMAGPRIDFRTGVGAARPAGRGWWGPFGIEYPDYERRLDDLRAALPALRRHWHGPAGGARAVDDPDLPSIPVTVAARGRRAMTLAATEADVWETSFCTAEEFVVQDRAMAELAGDRPLRRSLEIDGFVAPTAAGLDRLLARLRVDRDGEDLESVLTRALVGTPPEAAGQLDRLANAGVEQVVVALHDPLDPAAIEALAETRALARSA